MSEYQEGQPVRLEAQFFADLALTDPTNIELLIFTSGGQITVHSAGVTKDNVGEYSYEFIPSSPGWHSYQWSGTGAVIAYAEAEFKVTKKKTFS